MAKQRKKMKKEDQWALAILVILLLFLFLPQEPVDDGDSDVNVQFEVRSKDGLKQAMVDDVRVLNAQGRFKVTIDNSKIIEINGVKESYRTDFHDFPVAVGEPFEDAPFGFTSPRDIPSKDASYEYTGWFNLDPYGEHFPGDTEFQFFFEYTYLDAEGFPQPGTLQSEKVVVSIFKDSCPDGDLVGECDGTGRECIYTAGSQPYYQTTALCCVEDGGRMDGVVCKFACKDGLVAGECSTNPDDRRLTYCDGVDMEENCVACEYADNNKIACYDYHGNNAISCSDKICNFYDYGQDQVNIQVERGQEGLEGNFRKFLRDGTGQYWNDVDFIGYNPDCDGSDLDQYDKKTGVGWGEQNAASCGGRFGSPIMRDVPGGTSSLCAVDSQMDLYNYNGDYQICCVHSSGQGSTSFWFDGTSVGTVSNVLNDPINNNIERACFIT